MKKIFLLVFLVIFLTGCKAEVNLVITKDALSENIKIYDLKSSVYDFNNNINEDVARNIHIFEHEHEYYDIEEFEKNDIVGKIYSFTSDIDYLESVSRLRTCYDNIDVNESESYIQINTSLEYRCGYIFGANDVVLNISSDLKVDYTNADKVDGNVLTWYINEENYKNKNISIKYALKDEELDNKKNNTKNDELTKNSEMITIIIVGIIIIGLFLGYVIYLKVKKSND